MRVAGREVQYKYGEVVRIRVLSDAHYGHVNCDVKGFRKFVQEAPEGCLFVGLGDLMDVVIASDSKRYRKSSVAHDGDDLVDQQVEGLAGILEPVRERILGLGTGNHEDVITKYHGTNPTKRLCRKLDVPFLGFSWLYRLALSENGNRGRKIVIRGHHGWGGGSRTQGGDLTKFSKDMNYWDADAYVYGHVHRLQVDSVPQMGLVGMKLVAKPRLLVLAGTWKKTYVEGDDPDYGEVAGYPPVTMGGATLCIKPTRDSAELWAEL